MARATINYVEGTERTTFIYRLPGPRFAPRAWAWSLVGGLAVGVAAAVALAAVGLTGVGTLSFDAALIAGTAAGALALYAGPYRAALRNIGLRISFDYIDNVVGICMPNTQEWFWYPVEDVLDFRLARQTEGWRAGCSMVMDTESAGAITLVLAGRDCYEESGLPHLVTRLNARLQAISGGASSELPPPPAPAPLRPPTPARRQTGNHVVVPPDVTPQPPGEPPARRRLPDPRDVQH